MRTGGSGLAAFLPPRPRDRAKTTLLCIGRPLRHWRLAVGGRTGNVRALPQPVQGTAGLTGGEQSGPFGGKELDSARRIADQGRSSAGSRSLPFFDRSGSVHAERLKQQGRLFPLFIFEMLTSTRRLRVSGFFVALTQRTHSQRAIGVISSHRSWIFCGAAARAVARSWGTLGSGQSLVTSMSRVASSPALMPAACCSVSSTLIQWPEFPSGSSTVPNSTPLIVPWTATCPREGSFLLAACGNRNTVDVPIADSVTSKRMVSPYVV